MGTTSLTKIENTIKTIFPTNHQLLKLKHFGRCLENGSGLYKKKQLKVLNSHGSDGWNIVCSPSACLGAPAGWSGKSTGRWHSQRRVCSRPERATTAGSAASHETPEEEQHRGQRAKVIGAACLLTCLTEFKTDRHYFKLFILWCKCVCVKRKNLLTENYSGLTPVSASMSNLTLHECRVQPPLPALQAAAGLRPAVIGWAESLLQLPQLGAVTPQEVTAAQVGGDHQTLVAVEGFLHLLDKREGREKTSVFILPNSTGCNVFTAQYVFMASVSEVQTKIRIHKFSLLS